MTDEKIHDIIRKAANQTNAHRSATETITALVDHFSETIASAKAKGATAAQLADMSAACVTLGECASQLGAAIANTLIPVPAGILPPEPEPA